MLIRIRKQNFESGTNRKLENFMLKTMLIRYKKQMLYLVFGVETTMINILIYCFCYYKLICNNIISSIISWGVSVLFAYVTNKIYVFDSKCDRVYLILKELFLFAMCRVLTGVLDLVMMYIFVDIFNGVAWQVKVISNIFVIVCNYIAGKYVVFIRRNVK